MAVCMTCPHKAPQRLSQRQTPFFLRRCGLGKILVLFTRIFIHPNLELKKVPALSTLGKISIKNWPTYPTPMFAIRSCSASSQAHNLHWNKISQDFVCMNTRDALAGERR